MLVMKGRSLSQLILGFNVIGQFVKDRTTDSSDVTRREHLHETLEAAFPRLEKNNVDLVTDI